MSLDPVSVGTFVGKALASKAFTAALSKAASRLKHSEAERLLAIVGDDLNAAVGPGGLEPLLEDEHAATLIVELLADPASADEQALAAAIEPHVGRRDEDTDAAEYARRIAASLRRNVWRAQESDRAAIVGQVQTEVRGLRQEKALWASARFLSDEWIPRAALDRVKELAKTSPDEARSLEDALADEPNRRRTLKGLIDDPPKWVIEASAPLWSTLGHLAAVYGLIAPAEKAFVEAAERPGSDRASLYARASQLASDREANEEADEFIGRASAVDRAHPDVIAAQARREPDPQRRLQLLEGVEGRMPTEIASVEIARMLAFLALNDIDAATEACKRAREAAPNALFPRQMEAALVLARNRGRADEGDVDRADLYMAAGQFLDLAAELDNVDRKDEAARLRSQASACHSLAGDRVRAARLLEEIPQELTAADEVLVELVARAAFEARRPDVALAVIGPSPHREDLRLFRARARFELEDEDASSEIVEEAEALLTAESEGVPQEAALLRMFAALRYDDVDWSESAESIVRDADPALAAMVVAERLARSGQVRQAHDTLAPHQDDPRVLESLVRIAAQEEDWPTAIQRQRTLLQRAPTPGRRLDLAGLLESSGDEHGALTALAELRVDAAVPIDVRASAFGHSADILWRRGQVAEFATVAAAWLELVPDTPAAAWARVYGLVRLARYAEAVALIDERRLEPRQFEDARFAVQAFYRGLAATDAVPRIIAVSDRFERTEPWLELMVIVSGMGTRGAELSPHVRERQGRALAEFEERFPDSGMMRSLQIPETPEGLQEVLREQFDPEGATALNELNERVMRGKAGVAHLAAFVGKEVSELWTRLIALPLGFGNPVDAELEREDALAALDKPSVWDTAALYVVGGLGDAVEGAIRRALLGSVVPLAVLDDAAMAADGPVADDQGEVLEVGWDPIADEPRKTIYPPEEVERQRQSLGGVLRVAHELIVEDNVDPNVPSRFDELLGNDEDEDGVHRAMATMAATVIVADRLKLPVFSDDRFVRALARGAGLSTFGTPALLDALVERGRLQEEERQRARMRLRLSGAQGLPATVEEFLAEGRRSQWKLTPLLIAMLADRGLWLDALRGTDVALGVLRAVHVEAPDDFELWLARLVDAAQAARPEHGHLPPTVLLIARAWLSDDEDFIARLTKAAGRLRLFYGFRTVDDPIGAAASLFLGATTDLPEEIRAALLKSVLKKLDFRSQDAFLQRLRIVDGDARESTGEGGRSSQA